MTADAIAMNIITATNATRRPRMRLQRLAPVVVACSMRLVTGEAIGPATPVADDAKKAAGAAILAVAGAGLSPAAGAATSIIELSAAKGSGVKAQCVRSSSPAFSSAISRPIGNAAGLSAASPLPDFVTLATKR